MRIYNKLNNLLHLLAWPAIHHFYYRPDIGEKHGIGLVQKRALHRRIRKTTTSITSATSELEHLLLAAHLLNLDKEIEGDIIECGCFKGSSTSTLSLLAHMTGRKLYVCDSFAGLPQVDQNDKIHVTEVHGRYESYTEGEYCGHLDEVQANVAEYGDASVCEWVKGYFEDTLGTIDAKYCFAFLDVDLFTSLESCLEHIWPKMSYGATLYTHEAKQLQFAKYFFDDHWWNKHLHQPAPGLVGSGTGIPAGISQGTGLGWTKKTRQDDPITAGELQHFQGDPTLADPAF